MGIGTKWIGAIAALGLSVGLLGQAPASAAEIKFQNGVDGYTGAVGYYLDQPNPGSTKTPGLVLIKKGTADERHGLLRFDDIIGNGSNQIAPGTTIVKATLTIVAYPDTTGSLKGSSTNITPMHRMLHPWTTDDTWNSWGDGNAPHNSTKGIQADGDEAEKSPDASIPAHSAGETMEIDVTTSVQAWVNDPSKNYGWVLLPGGSDTWRFAVTSSTTGGNNFEGVTLSVVVPEPAAAGLIGASGLLLLGRRR